MLASRQCTCEVLWFELGNRIRCETVPQFWSCIKMPLHVLMQLQEMDEHAPPGVIDLRYQVLQQFITAVKSLKLEITALVELLKDYQRENCRSCSKTYDEKELMSLLRVVLLSQLPAHFKQTVHAYSYCSLRTFAHYYSKNSSNIDVDMSMHNEAMCYGCHTPIDKCLCQSLIASITETNDVLIKMELFDRIAGQTITSLVQKRINEHIKETCQGIFDKSHLATLEMWLNDVIISWLTRLFNSGNLEIDAKNVHIIQVIEKFKLKLTFFLYEIFARNLIEQFFSVIIDFPDSIPAIEDLKICLEKIDMRQYVIKSITNTLQARILHPGVNTKDILTGYIAAIKTIRHLDSSGLILAAVTTPIKEYLRKRSDTVRRVVTGLTEDGPTDLSEELAKGDACKMKTEINSTELTAWETWLPDPFGFDYNTTKRTGSNISRTADIITMMIDIYGSNELFMNEYRNLMADRLLTQLDFSPQKEIRNLELLKIRFGENLLHSCEVMLKDVADSKRINTHIQSDTKYTDSKLFDLSTLIISAQFWPPFNKEVLQLPDEIEEEFKKYTKSYEAYKGNRTLQWRHVTGRVNISLELEDRTLDMTVTPTQAIIIYHFQDRSVWTLEDLSNVMNVPSSILRRRMSFWQMQGLLVEESTGVYKLVETQKFDQLQISQTSEDDDIESAMASASDQREEELQVFWSYIVGMLTNLDSLPLERIHQMLKLFASQGSEFSQEELKNFLQRKVREHKLVFTGGVYQLSK